MLRYIIDAYNVIHKIPAIRDSNGPVKLFVEHIRRNKLIGSNNNEAIIVFDGYTGVPFKNGNITVKFSCNRQADDVIRDIVTVTKNKKTSVVVTDDRAVRDFSKASGVNIMGTAEFLKARSAKNRPSDDNIKNISYTEQAQITKELMDIWDKTDEE
ncbi:MAG: NYN domain-containing protein [Candidatus Omnitrophica bacterium]|jgi:hypothetical protein|nr:NYN domain-containing protein [Candidatus Omnitrophota bacterium]MDD5080553.1 NYN domain-containing protein [Candidatus Omnitrophota bacterium]MDD5441285.1 NYN domain-containing protein [Candidatus Omnitrophota bacterium]